MRDDDYTCSRCLPGNSGRLRLCIGKMRFIPSAWLPAAGVMFCAKCGRFAQPESAFAE